MKIVTNRIWISLHQSHPNNPQTRSIACSQSVWNLSASSTFIDDGNNRLGMPANSTRSFSVKERKSSLPLSRECYRSPWCRSSIHIGIWRSASRSYWPVAMAIGLTVSQTTEMWSVTGYRWCWTDWRLRATNLLSPCSSRHTYDTWNKSSCHRTWPCRVMRVPSSPPTTSDPSCFPVPVSCTSALARRSRTPISKSRVLIKINCSDLRVIFASALYRL